MGELGWLPREGAGPHGGGPRLGWGALPPPWQEAGRFGELEGQSLKSIRSLRRRGNHIGSRGPEALL